MSAAIATKGLSKRYPGVNFYALYDLNIEVQPGEVYGFLGANGAGKSTTIRTLLNFIQPTGGSATILGKDIVKDTVEVKRSIGYLSGEAAFYPKMTGQQFLDYLGALQPAKSPDYLKSLLKKFEADTTKPIGELSKGNRQKLGLIQALMHEPKVLILDEPTSGLDPLMQEVFYEEIKSAKQRGAAVFASSHNLGEVQRMCDRVGFIRAGKLVAEQTIADLVKVTAQTFDVTFATKAPLTQLRAIPQAEVKPVADNRVTIQIRGDLAPLLKTLAQARVTRLDKPAVDLEEEFLKFYTDDSQGTEQQA